MQRYFIKCQISYNLGDLRHDGSMPGSSQDYSHKVTRSLLVNNLDSSIGSEFLRELCSRYGKVSVSLSTPELFQPFKCSRNHTRVITYDSQF